MKNILELTSEEAKSFFLKQTSYCSIDFPVYFQFQILIDKVSAKLDGKPLSDFHESCFDEEKKKVPSNYEGVNYTIINNKDRKYSWRLLQLIHPAIYVSLVNQITKSENWTKIVARFNKFRQNDHILCMSLPIKSEDEQSDKAVLVHQWWQDIEQRSVELSLEYEYLLETDITDFYGSIYTHSIDWALHSKEVAKADKKNKTRIGHIIDKHIQDMSFGQTNGIPQGSVLMDFIAEMVLGYVDLQLGEKIREHNISDYTILRYRDDFRIFTNNPQNAELIVKQLTEILIDLGLNINSHKTIASSNVVIGSLKPDKLYWMGHKNFSKSLLESLFVINELSERHPNSGSLIKSLATFFDRIRARQEIKENTEVMISIIVNIMINSPRSYPVSGAILSKLLSFIKNDKDKIVVINKIIKRFNKIPNTGYIEIWLQRITLNLGNKFSFHEKLCNKVIDENVSIWNSEWLDVGLKDLIDNERIIDKAKFETLDAVISRKEVELFKSKYSDY